MTMRAALGMTGGLLAVSHKIFCKVVAIRAMIRYNEWFM